VLCKPLLASVKLTLAYEHVFAVAFEQRPTAVRADSVGNEGAGEAAERLLQLRSAFDRRRALQSVDLNASLLM
jgi:hypothetical protein